MLKRTSQIGVILFALILVMSLVVFTGCGNNLKGSSIIMASWHNAYNVDTWEPRNEEEEQALEYRRRLLQEQGFHYEVIELSDYDNYLPLVVSNIMSGNKDISFYDLASHHAMTLYKQGLLYPVSDSKAVDFNNRTMQPRVRHMYNGLAQEVFTFNGKTYAWSYGNPNDNWGTAMLFFNPQHLVEVGLSAEYLYDLQINNNWTWETFLDVCRKLTRDTTGNGVIDTYALPIDDAREFIQGLVYGNGGNFVTFDAQGRAVNGLNSPAVLEAFAFFNQLITEGLLATQPTYDWGWNWSAFADGRVAMTFDPEWRKGQMNDRFEAGYVLPPRGPRSPQQRIGAGVSVYAIPNIFSPAEVDVILKAAEMWNAPMSADWHQGHYWASRNLRDVTETVDRSRDAQFLTLKGFQIVPGYPFDEFINDFRADGLGVVNPAQHIESWMPRINSAIEDFNR